ncbi:MAG TPA: DUF4340 domain-containing protein [Candidatus Binatia bacterium]
MPATRTLLSLIVFIALGLYVYLFELRDKGQALLDFPREQVTTLIVTYQDQTIELNREPGREWTITHPIAAAADNDAVESILKTLKRTRINRVLETEPSERDIEAFGLKNAWATLAMITRSGDVLPPILVGNKAPLKDHAYVKRGDYSAVFLTSVSLRSILDKDLTEFRDKHILRFNQWNVAKVEIKKKKERLVLVRDNGGGWEMELPRKAKVKRKTVNAYLNTLLELKAQDFSDQEDGDLKPYRLDNPALVITFEGESWEKPETLLVSENEKFFAKRVGHPTVYTIDPISYISIHKTAADFLAG